MIEVLTAFIRERRPPLDRPVGVEQEGSAWPDVQAAVTVVGRRDVKRDVRRIDLTRADLTGAIFRGADPTAGTFNGADLTRADLAGAILRGTDLMGATLKGATLRGADLTDAILWRARLERANLTDAILTSAVLNGADLTRADLTGAVLTGTFLKGISHAARRRVAPFNDVHRDSLLIVAADLTGARWPADTPVPEDWKPDDSGQFESGVSLRKSIRTGALSDPTVSRSHLRQGGPQVSHPLVQHLRVHAHGNASACGANAAMACYPLPGGRERQPRASYWIRQPSRIAASACSSGRSSGAPPASAARRTWRQPVLAHLPSPSVDYIEEGIFHQMKVIRKPAGQRHIPEPPAQPGNQRQRMITSAIHPAIRHHPRSTG